MAAIVLFPAIGMLLKQHKEREENGDSYIGSYDLFSAFLIFMILIGLWAWRLGLFVKCFKQKKSSQEKFFELMLYILLGPLYYYMSGCSK